jgi:signal transduction histidine kinase
MATPWFSVSLCNLNQMSLQENIRPKLTLRAALQCVFWLTTGSYASILVGKIDSSLLLYLPAALGIIFVHWYGLRVLPLTFLNGLLTVFLWKAKGSFLWILFLASHEPAVALVSWLLARHLIDWREGFKDTFTFSKFILLGIVVPNLVNSIYTYHYSFIQGDLEQVLLLWLADFITIYCIAIPALHFLRPRKSLGFHLALETISERAKRGLPEVLLLLVFFPGLNFFIDFKQYWFVYSICTIVVALRWGFSMAVFSNLVLFALSYLMPLMLEAGNVRILQSSSQQVSVHVGMATMFFVSALIGRAVSDFREKEEELNLQKKNLVATNEQLKKTNLDLDRFVYSVSHDISAPLKSIKGLVSLFRMDDSANTPSAKVYLEKIDISINKLETFIEEVLDHSRASRKEIKSEAVYLNTFLEEVLDNLKYIENFGRIKFQYKLNEPVVAADHFLLKVIVSNLISNAIKYQKEFSGHTPEIVLMSEKIENTILISVSDNGEGIAPENQSRIFDMFYRGSRQSKGSGLGLFIALEAAQRMKGDITFQSEQGRGTTFTLILPA